MLTRSGQALVLGAFGAPEGVVNECTVAVLQACAAGTAFTGHDPFIALRTDDFGLPRVEAASGVCQAQPNSWSRSSSMPKWWAISWITVTATSSTTSSGLPHTSSSASR